MKAAVIFSIPMIMAKRFAWRWRSEDHTKDSTRSFAFYEDCVTDAQRNGYKVARARIEGSTDRASGFIEKHA
jgi:hypothetical protein